MTATRFERSEMLLQLQRDLGVSFMDPDLLNLALTHPTYVFEHRGSRQHNQRLEFLGDAVLGMIVAEYLFKRYPNSPEGELTKLRASLVCENTLADNASRLKLGRYLLLGRGEEMSGGRHRASILADAYEALVGAVYLDSSLETARKVVEKDIEVHIERKDIWVHKDYKTVLQELVQKHHNENVTYSILSESGPDHDKRFVAGVSFKGKLLAQGKGRSKKEAEQEAARQAYQRVHKMVKSL